MSVVLVERQKGVLLTGATGLIGGELLGALLRRQMGTVWVLVRAQDAATAEGRLLFRLRRSGEQVENLRTGRVVALCGDLSQAGLGLDERSQRDVAERLDLVIHCAAETSFLRTRSCRETNVSGVENLVRFTKRCPRDPLFVYMGTAASNGVGEHRCVSEADAYHPEALHYNEYTRSKALGEKIVRESGLQVLVLRPSIVFSAGVPDPVFARAMLWCVPLLNTFDCMPINPAARLDCVPVSFVVDMALSLLGSRNRQHHCYHLSAGPAAAVTCGALAAFCDDYYARTRSLQLVPLPEWTPQMHRRFVRTAAQRKLFSMLRPYLPFLNMDVVYDNTRLREDVGERATRVPAPTTYLGGLLDTITGDVALVEAMDP